jgi:hypothetical protein
MNLCARCVGAVWSAPVVAPVSEQDRALSASVAADADERERAQSDRMRRLRRALAGLCGRRADDFAALDRARRRGERVMVLAAEAEREHRARGTRSAGAVPIGRRNGVTARDRQTATMSEYRAQAERAILAQERRTLARRRAIVAEYRGHSTAAFMRALALAPVPPTRIVRTHGASSDVAVWSAPVAV